MFCTYILQSRLSGEYYIGSCCDLKVRLREHNNGKVRSTKSFVPWEVAYTEIFNSRKEAVARERQIKSWKSRKAIERLIKKHF